MPVRGKTLFGLIVILLLAFSVPEFASAQCAIKPIKPTPPLGCKDVTPQCVTSSNGQSYWNWICVPQRGGAEPNTGQTLQSPAPERAIPGAADQNPAQSASVNPVVVAPQTHVPISEDSKPAVETLRMIAQRIGACQKVLFSESQWGRKKDEIVRFYYEPPENLVWDVVAGNSVRAPYLGYAEFTLDVSYWVPESVQPKFLQSAIGLQYLKSVVGPYHYRYEYDLGPDGLQLTRALWRYKNSPEWKDAGKSASLCSDVAARDTQAKATALPDERGEDVPQDKAQAAAPLRKAAEQGDAKAQDLLAQWYSSGCCGVPLDDAQAALWWRRAADQGDAAAQLEIGLFYENGMGVPQDYAEAYFWLDIAAASNATKGLDKDRDEAASHLTQAVLLNTQERARKWLEQHPAKPQ